MPEGPEVQTVVSGLKKCISNKTIKEVILSKTAQKLIKTIDIDMFKGEVENSTVKDVIRHGKYIDIALSSGIHLVTHLLMTGQLIYKDNQNEDERPKYLRIIFTFNDGSELCLGDRSRWVKIDVVPDDAIKDYKYFNDLGIDIFSKQFTLENFKKVFNTKRVIHPFLLDQHVISGLGNIYVSETLYESGIYPTRKVNEISEEEIEKLYHAIKRITKKALEEKGTTFSDYRTPDGSKGNYQNFLQVFKRDGMNCNKCGTIIEKIQVNGRSAYLCPNEQKK